ncbi:uncharacterized protein LOC106778738 [Vigna radiata var. radiata]|uniref:Uncharacterized protein LOC106778738 n=1 Tax=Vigna radiata var. radiata TaxID=3916 RepID=A0A1S3VUZ6_VIGRR|nr:uncharacterized protein LOC106778738 [Vigna radiata var. radiata]
MWEVLQVTHEGTDDVKRAKKNTLIQEYEMFRMQQGETIADVQKRFTHIVNHLFGLGKKFDTNELNVKILKSLNRIWQPKVTTITESQDLTSMPMAVLFGKLREHELELNRLSVEEAQGKRKTLAFKTENSKGTSLEKDEESEDEDEDDDDMIHMFRKFNKFMKLKGKDQFKKDRKKKQRSSSNYRCYGCGEKGRVNADCPNLKKGEEKKSLKKKNVYIAWNDNASSTCSNDFIEEANLCLTTIVDDTTSQWRPKKKPIIWAINSNTTKVTSTKGGNLTQVWVKVRMDNLRKRHNSIDHDNNHRYGKTKVKIGKALIDLGSSINLIPLSLLERIGGLKVKSTKINLQMTDGSTKKPYVVAEDVVVCIEKLKFLVAFVVMEIEEDEKMSIILRRPFMKTAKVIINVDDGMILLQDQEKKVIFNVFKAEQQTQEEMISHKAAYEDAPVTSPKDAKPVIKGMASSSGKRIKTIGNKRKEPEHFYSNKFLSRRHEQNFLRVQDRRLLMECKVRWITSFAPQFGEELERREWENVVAYPTLANIAVVKDFDTNARALAKSHKED